MSSREQMLALGGGLSIIVGSDGTCPQSTEAVRANGPGSVRIFPTWRPGEGLSEEALGLGFRFGVIVRNRDPRPRRLQLTVDWQIPQPHPRRVFDFLYALVAGAADWQMIHGTWDFPVARFCLSLPPGDSWLGLNPRYNLADLDAFITRLKQRRHHDLTIRVAGHSGQGRPIPILIIGDPGRSKHQALICARAHPYESGGSYALEAMVDFLLGDAAATLRCRYAVHVLPMLNPDGVYNGLSRLTDLRGANLNLVHTKMDPAHDSIQAVIKEVRPAIMIDLHQFLERDRDDVRSTDASFLARLAQKLPDQSHVAKRWNLVKWELGSIPEEQLNWSQHMAREYGGWGLLFELPWFGRTAHDMRTLGAALVQAVFATHTERTES